MRKVYIGFRNLSVPKMILRGRHIVIFMTGNPNFTTPMVSLASIDSKLDALQAAYDAALDGDRIKKALMRNLAEELIAMMNQQGDYVEAITQGDEMKILSSGFGVQKQREPIGPLPAPSGLKVKGAGTAKVIAFTKAVKGKTMYVWQSSTGAVFGTWEQLDASTNRRIEITKFTTGTLLWVRVAAFGTAGLGPYSDPVFVVVP